MKSAMKKSVFSTTKEDTSILFTPCERQEESGNNDYLGVGPGKYGVLSRRHKFQNELKIWNQTL